MGQAKIDIRGVGVDFVARRGDRVVPALRDISLQIQDREFVCLLGPSGCGKTTLLNCIAGFIEPTVGEIRLDDRPIDGPGSDRGVVFQSYTLLPWLTAEGNVAFALAAAGRKPSEVRDIARVQLALVGLDGFEEAYPNELSGGMKQRVGIARALANQPEVLLLDEPFGALDAQTRERMQGELLKIWQSEQRTCVFVTHSIVEAAFLADRIVVMTARPGRVKRELTVSIPRPRDRTSEDFIALYRDVDSVLREEIEKASAANEGRAPRE